MHGTDDGDNLDAAPLEFLGHFNRHEVAATGGNDEGTVHGAEVEISQNSGGQSADIFQEHGLPLTIGPDHQIVEAQGQLHDRIKAGKGAIARPHFLHHDPTVT